MFDIAVGSHLDKIDYFFDNRYLRAAGPEKSKRFEETARYLPGVSGVWRPRHNVPATTDHH